MESLNDRAANLLRSLRDLTGIIILRILELTLVNVLSAINTPLGLGIRGYAAFGFLATADRRTFC